MVIRNLPNTLSLFRVILAICLLGVWHQPFAFIMVYIVCGLTDILDGYLARKLNVTSMFGSMLDGLGDMAFFSIVSYWIIFKSNLTLTTIMGLTLVVIISVRFLNLIISKIKYNHFGIMHTLLNKATGAIFFLVIPFLIANHRFSFIFSMVLLFAALLSSIEETIILICSNEYDENHKSILSRSFFENNGGLN